MTRFFLPPDQWGGPSALTGGEAVHCVRVMRIQAGDEIEVFDGEGRSARAKVVSADRNRVELRLGEERFQPTPQVPITIAIGVLKGKAMDLLVQKAVELGVSVIQPLLTERTIARREAEAIDRWKRDALEACKQCGSDHLPKVERIQALADYLAEPVESGCTRIIASLAEGAPSLRSRIETASGSSSVRFLIGPEGDFTAGEGLSATEAGYLPANLGERVLRSETAAFYCIAASRYAFA